MTPSLIYCSANTVLTCNIKLSLKQIAIDRNFQSMPVRAICYWDCETKYIASNDRYRYTFDQTYLFGTIGIDTPLTKHIVAGNRYRQTFQHLIGSDDRYRYVDLSPFYCFSVGAQRRSEKTRLGTINSNSPFLMHGARPPAQQGIPEYCVVCPCCALSLRWMVSTTRW